VAIPVIDLFAGPGGLGEGFSSFRVDKKNPFKIKVSVEKDFHAHQTLELRAFFRQFELLPEEYYEYVKGKISRDDLFSLFRDEADAAGHEAMLAELGSEDDDDKIMSRIANSVSPSKPWVLIGGPPCQAYSLVGRNRRSGEDRSQFEEDPRHTLYREYLKIIALFHPSIFVMENVRGILSSKHNGKPIFNQILSDLRNPHQAFEDHTSDEDLRYDIFSFAVSPERDDPSILQPSDYILRSEDYGIPQKRHRVILLGIRSDLNLQPPRPLNNIDPPSVKSAILDLPRLRSRIGNRWESVDWSNSIASHIKPLLNQVGDAETKNLFRSMLNNLDSDLGFGANFVASESQCRIFPDWFHDERLSGALNHEVRSHMPADLARYFYYAVMEQAGCPTTLNNLPEELLPNHKNAKSAIAFVDRFKVQAGNRPSSTVTSHISKDGHYFIHPDPTMARSLTVREAARLQTFPDNYFFEGPRTQQYHQVGNAVPPLLAHYLAERVHECIS